MWLQTALCSPLDRGQYATSHQAGRPLNLMFPSTNDTPSLLRAHGVYAHVPIAIALNLHLPVLLIRLWLPIAFLAAMPEATVDEDRDARGGKNHIRVARNPIVVQAITAKAGGP